MEFRTNGLCFTPENHEVSSATFSFIVKYLIIVFTVEIDYFNLRNFLV